MSDLLRRGAAAGLAAVAFASVALPATARVEDHPDVAALVARALDVPVVAADGHARAVVAFEAGLPGDVLPAMTDLGVVRGIELQAIDAVAVTAPPAVLALVAELPGVTAVEPQRRIQLDLYASRAQIDAEDLERAEQYTRPVRGEDVTVAHEGLTGAAGDGSSTIGLFTDAAHAVSVAAACKSVDSGCTQGQVITDFSSRGAQDGTGPQVDVAAPGDRIMAALSPSVLAPLTECPEATLANPGYFCISGTSMAAPHVAGVAALMYEVAPLLTPAELEQCLEDGADDLLAPGVDRDSGHGMVDARTSVACATTLTAAGSVGEPTPAPDATGGEQPAGTPGTPGDPLPATGGGLGLAGLGVLALAGGLRRRGTSGGA